jgi:F-type H+-transporting ATPase subunit gamma
MELVATSRIKRAQERIEAARPYSFKMIDVLQNLAKSASGYTHPLLEVHDKDDSAAVLLLTADRGLCGAFNSNIIRQAENLLSELESQNKQAKLIVVGKKGVSYFRYVGRELYESVIGISDKPSFDAAKDIARKLIELYTSEAIDRVYLLFNQFVNVSAQKVTKHSLLPILSEAIEAKDEEKGYVSDYIFEPSDKKVLDELLPVYVETLVYRTLLESAASELGARRTAMKAATDNAEEMIKTLTRSYNRARQSQITMEISEIVGGANALEG